MKAYSAPGKAMLAGGYLVLDPVYNSYVTALSARMHAIVNDTVIGSTNRIVIRSPQFGQGEWVYEVDDFAQIKELNGRRNPFLEATVLIVLNYVQPKEFNVLIDIYSDPGFHSQEDTVEKKLSKKKFLYHTKAIQDVAKTGLGSSACLVTIVTTGLLSYFGIDVTNKNVIHNTAQIAHCLAQKKVGSGFDVAAAVFGSIIYRRFDALVVDRVLKVESKTFATDLKTTIDSEWSFNNTVCTLPPHIKLLMGDIQGGSETPKLVGKILAWRKEYPKESGELYFDLNAANDSFVAALNGLHHLYAHDRKTYLEATQDFAKIIEIEPFGNLVKSIEDIRKNLRKLTALSGASVEPEAQTVLLDECSSLPGCFGGVVPGAGGYDAIALLVVDRAIEGVKEKVESVCWLDLQEEKNGLVIEDVGDYA